MENSNSIVTATVTDEWLQKLILLAEDEGFTYESYEGSLLDNYIFYGTNKVKISNESEPTEYIIIKEYFVNEWSSGLQLVGTNNYDTVEEYINVFEEEE